MGDGRGGWNKQRTVSNLAAHLTRGRSFMSAESVFRIAAKARWPQAQIVGDGRFALHCPVTSTVHLYDFWMLAATEIARDHSNWRCKDSHTLVELQPLPARKPIRNLGLLERD